METEVWFRNPRQYIRQLAEYGESNMVWLRGDLIRRRTDPIAYTKGYFGPNRSWRSLVVATTGAHEYTHESGDEADYKACYPVWQFGEPMGVLEALCADNVGDSPLACSDPTIDPFYRPVRGQEHRVVIMDLPPTNTGAGRRFLTDVGELQESFPGCIIHLSGPWSYTAGFSFGARSMDWDPHFTTSKNKIALPNGRTLEVPKIDANKHGTWIHLLGYQATQEQFASLSDVLAFNVASAKWAGKYYRENINFRVKNNITTRDYVPLPTKKHVTTNAAGPRPGDMVVCDSCTMSDRCKYYRDGAVCSVPGSNVSELAKHFRTRDSGAIIDGLGALVALEVDRIQEGRENEVENGELDADLTKAIHTAFNHGVDLAKLVDPTLRSPKLAVQINNGTGGPNIAVMAADVVKALEAKGIPRSEQTPELIMKQIGAAPQVLEGRVIEDGSQPR